MDADGTPHWQDDPHFTINAHLHRIALPAPHDQAALQDLVSTLMSTPLDLSKSPWQFHLIEEYGAGCVLLTRLHHCIADGIALMRVLLSLTDATAEPPLPATHRAGARQPRAHAGPIAAANATVRAAEKLLDQGIETLLEPARLADAAQFGASSAVALSRLLLMSPDPQTLFKGELGVSKRAAWSARSRWTMSKRSAARLAAPSTMCCSQPSPARCDATCWGAAQLVDGLDIRAAVPVNLRSPNEPPTLGNRFGLIFLSLPIGADDPLDRLYDLKQRMEAIKDSPEALVTFGVLHAIGLMTEPIAGCRRSAVRQQGHGGNDQCAWPARDDLSRRRAGARADVLGAAIGPAGAGREYSQLRRPGSAGRGHRRRAYLRSRRDHRRVPG